MSGVTFWRWFQANSNELASLTDTKKIVDRVYDELAGLDKRLGIEISEPDELGVREIIITANGHQQLFDDVDNLVKNAPDADAWRIISLKPPRGFEFKYQQDGNALSPSNWKVLPLQSPNGELALRIFVPGRKVVFKGPILQVLIETGIGERAFAEIHHLEYTQTEEELTKNSWLEIGALEAFLKWRRTKGNRK